MPAIGHEGSKELTPGRTIIPLGMEKVYQVILYEYRAPPEEFEIAGEISCHAKSGMGRSPVWWITHR